MLKIAALDYLRLGARIDDAQGIFGFLEPEEKGGKTFPETLVALSTKY